MPAGGASHGMASGEPSRGERGEAMVSSTVTAEPSEIAGDHGA
jgi:hypothetical protein